MKTKIDNFNINLIKGQTQILPKENKIQDTKTKKAENLEVSKLFEQSELIKSYPSFIKERKISNDSISICGSQAETLSQTSESSFFLSLTNQNKSFQLNSSNEIIQNEKKLEKNIPFYHGFEEYFLKLMPDKFSEYKNSKNFLPKNYFYKKGNNDEDTNSNPKNNNYSRIRNKEKGQSQSQNILQFTNCFYLPCFRIYCPINAYYINNFSTVIINNNNNNNNNNNINNKEENYEKENLKEKKEESNEHENKKLQNEKIEKENEKEELAQDQDKGQEKKSFLNSYKKHYNYPNYAYTQKYNYKRNLNQEYNYNSQKYNNQKYYNRKYNKFSDYYSENDFQKERNSYYNNNYYKRRHHNIYENRFYKY